MLWDTTDVLLLVHDVLRLLRVHLIAYWYHLLQGLRISIRAWSDLNWVELVCVLASIELRVLRRRLHHVLGIWR